MAQEIPGQSQQMPQDARSQTAVASPKKKRGQKTPATVSDILDRRNESRRYMQINYWDEWEDAYRATKCRTKAIETKDKNGNWVEDKTRTNVAMPELSLIVRRKTARLTANPPQINYDVQFGGDTGLADRLTAWAYQQYDRSGEAQEHRKMVQTATTFGLSHSKLLWDTVEVQRRFFRQMSTGKPYSLDRRGLMQLQGAPDDEVEASVKEAGNDLSDSDLTQAIAKYGNSVQTQQRLTQYEGPVSKNVFVGDLFYEPGCATFDLSGWIVENYFESDLWLEKMAAKTYIDPETQEELPIFDPKAIADLEAMPSWQPIYQQQPFDLRSRLRTNALGQTLPLWPTKLLKGKRYDVLECHTRDKEGQFWIEWVGNESVYLGKMPYPWDLYGRYVYTEFVPLFDILSVVGDSSPRLNRWLWLLHNSIVGSRRDLVANILRPMYKAAAGVDVTDEIIERAFMRIVRLRNPNDLQPMNEHASLGTVIQAASEEEAQVMRMIAIAEPSLSNVEAGTNVNPQAGKTATTAILSAKSADALTQFEMDSLSWYLKQSGEKKLAMLQQTEPETGEDGGYQPISVAADYAGKVNALTQRYGQAQKVNIDFLEIQQEITVEPEAMSMLSVDDDIRRNAALQMAQAAAQAPQYWDLNYVNKFFAQTIRGVDPDKAVPPPKPPPPIPPKFTVTVAVKWSELPLEAQQAILSSEGVQVTPQLTQEMGVEKTLQGIEKMSVAGDAADNLMGSGEEEKALNQANAKVAAKTEVKSIE